MLILIVWIIQFRSIVDKLQQFFSYFLISILFVLVVASYVLNLAYFESFANENKKLLRILGIISFGEKNKFFLASVEVVVIN